MTAAEPKADLLIIDTAGRLHTVFNLMEELKDKAVYRWTVLPARGDLVLDATTGQNGLLEPFTEYVGVTSWLLMALARGGIAPAIPPAKDSS